MTTIADRVFDNGLTVLDTEANAVHITSQEAATYAAATSTYSLGNSASVSFGAPQDGSVGGGREVVMGAIADGEVTANGTATHFAIVDTVNSRLLATGPLSPTQAVTAGNDFSLGAITVGFPDPA